MTEPCPKMQSAQTGVELGLDMSGALTASHIVFYAVHESPYYSFQPEYPAYFLFNY